MIIKDTLEKNSSVLENSALKLRHENTKKLETLGILAGGIVHDFNNLLTPIIGHAEMLLKNASDPSALQDDVASILKAANRARNLVDQILPSEDQVQKELQATDINEILNEALSFVRTSISDQISIRTYILTERNFVLADPVKIYQVIINLCTNACQAMSDTGTLSVTISSSKRLVKLMVTDTGAGITKEIQSKIFEPFFTTRESGTGLGLATTYGIVAYYGGDIIVRSRLNKGTSFIISLPNADAEQH